MGSGNTNVILFSIAKKNVWYNKPQSLIQTFS